MNITELARILKITPNELRESLPKLGFDIGFKAIKINRNVANRIIKEWPSLKRKLDAQRRQEKQDEEMAKDIEITKKELEIPEVITVRDFAHISSIPVKNILSVLMKNGIFASLNEKIDYDTAWLVGSEIGLEIKPKKIKEDRVAKKEDSLQKALGREDKEKLKPRPPVIVVMGHVDHGKTKLLDAIRRTNVVEGEAGGITQHIGAYQVVRRKKPITFIDTPGHEAFTAMRSRGARVADIAILVVAADDGVKPQTIEAFRIIEAAKVPFLVAINKVDKEEANIDKTKQELSNQLNIVPEDWGGKIVCVPVSALKNEGITDLLDMVLLLTDTVSENIRANPDAAAIGTVIESHVDKGSGPVATLLVQNGTLRIGDQLVFDNIIYGKVRNLFDYLGQKLTEAIPATPTQIIGLKTLPQVGDILEVGEGEKVRLKKIKGIKKTAPLAQTGEELKETEKTKKINIIIKSDVLGSSEAIEESLEKINTEEVKIKIIHKGLGNISDGDIKRAEASGGQIIGFNVKVPPAIEELARERQVTIKLYSIIYDLINDIKDQMELLVGPKIKREEIGKLQVRAVFQSEKGSQIAGGKVTEGKVEKDASIEIIRDGQVIE
ncbi:translation initiation factor IF-2, partial [Patescibacteria group bacterium]